MSSFLHPILTWDVQRKFSYTCNLMLFFFSPGKPILQTIIKIKTYARETQIKNAYHVSMTCTHLRNGQTKALLFLPRFAYINRTHSVC